MEIPKNTVVIEGKEINEYRFNVQMDDCFILTSDGTLYAGTEMALNMNWTWEHLSKFAVEEYKSTKSPIQMANKICQKCNELYGLRPGDDTTAAVMRVTPSKLLKIMSGPPANKEDDERMVSDFMQEDATRIVCGETTSRMVAHMLGQPFRALNESIYQIDGIALATEGIVTMNEAIDIVQEYVENDDVSEEFFDRLEADTSGASLARSLIENYTDVIIYVGNSEEEPNPNLDLEVNSRKELVRRLAIFIEALGRYITVKYY